MLVSALQQSEPAIHIHISPYLLPLASPSLPPSLSHPSRWSQSTELISLCYAAADFLILRWFFLFLVILMCIQLLGDLCLALVPSTGFAECFEWDGGFIIEDFKVGLWAEWLSPWLITDLLNFDDLIVVREAQGWKGPEKTIMALFHYRNEESEAQRLSQGCFTNLNN